jgi:hypothetical protein
VLQILPRGTQETSTPKIVDITSLKLKLKQLLKTFQIREIQNKTVETQTEMPSTEKEDKNTQTTLLRKISSNKKLNSLSTLKLR